MAREGRVLGIGRLSVRLQKDGLIREKWRLSCHRGWLKRGLLGTLHPAFTPNPLMTKVLMGEPYVSHT